MTGRETLKLLILLVIIAALAMAAMLRRSDESIRSYTVTRPAPSHRMLAAIVPAGEQAWFFKLSGKHQDVSTEKAAFDEFIKSLSFAGLEPAKDPPNWKLPPGWRQREGDQSRYATLEVDTSTGSLECSVTVLPMKKDVGGYVLDNINRWRGQMSLAQLQPNELADSTTEVAVPGSEFPASVVDLEGAMAGGGMARSPMAGGGMSGGGMTGGGGPMTSGAGGPSQQLQYDTPEGWVPGELEVSRGGISVRRAAAFEVRDGDARVEITVTLLPAGALMANVNRWRSQIGLGEMSPSTYEQEKKQIDYAGQAADYIQFFGDQEAILGVIAVQGEMAWFVKLQGPAELARREQSKFEAFVKSIRLE